jgi:CheY-like chemotaxis protein
MPNGGTLSIAADNVDLTTADANLIPHARPGSFVMIMVADTGSGIPKEIQSRIFDPFFTTKPQGQGTGLGLSVVASVLKNHQSFLHLESEPESGSSFEIYLPKSAAATTIITRPTLIDLPRGNNQTILVIDDEQAIRDMLVTALKDQGYQPLTAANAAQALTRLHDHPQIQLVLLDHILPDQPGIQLLSDIHQQLPHLPAILASGSNNPELPDHLKTNPRIKLLSKPYPLEQLFPTLQQLLQSQ